MRSVAVKLTLSVAGTIYCAQIHYLSYLEDEWSQLECFHNTIYNQQWLWQTYHSMYQWGQRMLVTSHIYLARACHCRLIQQMIWSTERVNTTSTNKWPKSPIEVLCPTLQRVWWLYLISPAFEVVGIRVSNLDLAKYKCNVGMLTLSLLVCAQLHCNIQVEC